MPVWYKCYIYIEMTFLKELMLIKQANQNSDIWHYWYFLHRGFKFQLNVCNGFHDVLMSTKLSDIDILNIHGADYPCIISGISKSEAITLIQNIDLT